MKKSKNTKRSKKTHKTKRIPNLIERAIAEFKKDEPDWESLDQSDLYGSLESHIDGLLYEKEYRTYRSERGNEIEYGDDNWSDDELRLERLVFDAVRRLQKGRRHTCDPHYDDAFDGCDGY